MGLWKKAHRLKAKRENERRIREEQPRINASPDIRLAHHLFYL
ncbi:hypothetical protein ACS15_0659 [Ralstonia insidiosa]|uniref:Uncharacterized protein n=1 Tax=Ralstonia insidiosa TaxID=190721 RepID=A0AAC9FR35_9RALS|nr:hypothetical protein ACS15_0659 [Ralstonia insidiosa]